MNDEEIEIKLDLSNDGNYQKLLNHFGGECQTRLQENYFFDTPERTLAKRAWALRVRMEGATAFLAAKGPAARTADGVTIRPEVETDIPPSLARGFIDNGITPKSLPDAIRRVLSDLPDDLQLAVFIFFRNHRSWIVYADFGLTLELEIDRTEFADGTVDYELEVELPHRDLASKALPVIHRLMNTLDIPIIPQREGKFSRALKRKPNA